MNLVNAGLVSEAWLAVAPWISLIVRLHAGSTAVELEWTVGPVDLSDGQGKEVILRLNSSLASQGVWFTDSNGREFQQRVRNQRPTWKWDPTQPVAGNYYPVNAAAWLTDDTSALVVNVDRTQGCSSMADGSLEFMLHRRMTQDDGRGVGEPLSEPGLDGRGLIITGTTIVHLSPVAEAAEHARFTGVQLYSPLHQSYAQLSGSVQDYLSGHLTNATFLKSELPLGLELMSAQVWRDGQVLIRLSHQFGAGESERFSTPITVDLASLFTVGVSAAQELTLTAALPKGARTPYTWNTTDSAQPRRQPRSSLSPSARLTDLTVTIAPMEVRTFAITIQQPQ